jgi:mannose-6-phosphate isomerase-like protein (cupin superfamily)
METVARPTSTIPRRTRVRKAVLWLAGALLIYVAVGNALHRVVFVLPAPDPATYPRAGDEFGSTWEGFHLRVREVVNGMAVVELRIEPGAPGPPLHFHRGFAEEFTVTEGVLHIELQDRVVTVEAGESFRVEPLVGHRPFNPGTEPVVVASDQLLIPQSFAACLAQLYPLLDEAQGVSFSLLLQMSVVDPICDTHLAGPPRAVVALLNWFLAPAARLLGYRNYEPARSLHPHG